MFGDVCSREKTSPAVGFILFTLGLLSACGGGGGETKNGNTAPQMPLAAHINVAENSATTGYAPHATDSEADELSYHISGGADQSLFTLENENSALHFVTPANFENPADENGDNRYLVEITATDGRGGSTTQTVTVAIIDTNETPVFTSLNYVEVQENNLSAFYTAAAQDDDNHALSFELSGGDDQAHFQVDTQNGNVFFTAPPDFENPNDINGDNLYQFELSVTDQEGTRAHIGIDVRVLDQHILQLETSYPTPNANLGGFVEDTVVRGRIVDIEDGLVEAGDTASVSVNGQPAQLSTDNHWSAQVPIEAPGVTIEIAAEFSDGSFHNIHQRINNQVVLSRVVDVSIDKENNRAFILDWHLDALVSVDLTTGNRTIVSGDSRGTGPHVGNARSIALDKTNNRAIVISSHRTLLSVDLISGDRTRIGESVFNQPEDVIMGTEPNQALVLDVINSGSSRLLEVDLTTGEGTIISSCLPLTGVGQCWQSPISIAIDETNNSAYVLDSGQRAVFLVDLNDGDNQGNRSVLSSNTPEQGVPFQAPVSIIINPEQERLLVVDRDQGVLAVDIDTGEREAFSNINLGQGPNFNQPLGSDLNENTHEILVTGFGHETLLSVDLNNGDRNIASPNVGSGIRLGATVAVGWDNTLNRAIWLDYLLHALVEIDPSSGNRAILSGADIGTGADLYLPAAIELDAANERALIISHSREGNNPQLMSVDLNSGERITLSDNSDGEPILDFPTSISLNTLNGNALALGHNVNELFSIDLETGDREVISDSSNIGEVEFNRPRSIDFDEQNGSAIVLNTDPAALLSVNLENGFRSILSDDSTGLGVQFEEPIAADFHPENRRMYIVDEDIPSILSIDISNGNRSILSANGDGKGLDFANPERITVDTNNDRAFVTDSYYQSLFVVDLISGERALMSK